MANKKFKIGYIKRDELISIIKFKNQELYDKDKEIEKLRKDKDNLIVTNFIFGSIICFILISLAYIKFTM